MCVSVSLYMINFVVMVGKQRALHSPISRITLGDLEPAINPDPDSSNCENLCTFFAGK